MPDAAAYLVARRNDGYGDVFPLAAGHRYTLGRASTAQLVLRDEMCSREHAEVSFAGGRWSVRDLKSLNGTRVNGERLDGETDLTPGDEVALGRTALVFVEDLENLPPAPPAQPDDSIGQTAVRGAEGTAIKKRLGDTSYLAALDASGTPSPDTAKGGRPGAVAKGNRTTRPTRAGRDRSRDLALLYRLALDMGAASDWKTLTRIVLDGLLEAIPAEVGAVLTLKAGRQFDLSAYRHRDPHIRLYNKVSEFVSGEVLSTREAILAEDVALDQSLKNRESISELGATSLICAPILVGDKVRGLIHLYSTDLSRQLDPDDLEFAVAVAKQLGMAVRQVEKQDSLSAENRSLRAQLKVESELVGSSPSMKLIESQVARVAGTNATVLIRGESGTGKELVARAIHYNSGRRDGPFICLNCAALTESLLESELFGHEKGAFTGATDRMAGKFEVADKGTIFLDEIGEMNLGTQAKLLRVLEGHPFERVGGNTPIRVDVRVVAATNSPLEQAISAGAFRRDLFFRLQVVEFRVPPLRERGDDVPALADHFLKRFVRETGRKIIGFSPEAAEKMRAYHWPGNVRELRNVVERAVALGNDPEIEAGDIWLSSLEAAAVPWLTAGPTMPASSPAASAPAAAGFEPCSLEDLERQHIERTLRHTAWNKSQAASLLRIERSTLDRKIKAYDLHR